MKDLVVPFENMDAEANPQLKYSEKVRFLRRAACYWCLCGLVMGPLQLLLIPGLGIVFEPMMPIQGSTNSMSRRPDHVIVINCAWTVQKINTEALGVLAEISARAMALWAHRIGGEQRPHLLFRFYPSMTPDLVVQAETMRRRIHRCVLLCLANFPRRMWTGSRFRLCA